MKQELPLEEIEVALIGSMAHEEREQLNPVEQARACATLKDELGLSFQQLGDRLGCHKAKIANMMRLLKLPEEILERGSWTVAASAIAPAATPIPKGCARLASQSERRGT